MFKTAIKEFLVFSEAEYKAISNCIIIPLILTLLTRNLLVGLCWVLFITIIYKFIHKNKTENAKVFFDLLKALSLILLFTILLSLTIIII
ncbi:hypothetical protein PJV92_11530 [Aliarcobacter butzleri]|uniref:Uncharacterized protein n=1 Tax=Aliarcobacter butzleri TaxID=28197 RepID=A0AAP4Q0L3_9BACT|nr:hypothetical protein [Aliarcobacter butzleri]MDN5051368.1 hypothetical protein [Aliarcobacter butzleri]MDN5074201.1 hypothetical protein [Aliarcobacter butzleri]MDN5115618.1 hypothetical protein [Aliarcobacter butzleri]MDN5133350.1 hypothetical protein [Aliarcobacter butzleri]